MRIATFSAENFRSITKCGKLEISHNTVLIGPNNEGKSNLVRGMVTALGFLRNVGGIRTSKSISVLKYRLSYRTKEYFEWINDFPIGMQSSNPTGTSNFHIEFELSREEVAQFKREVGSHLDGYLPIRLAIGAEDYSFRVTKRGPGAQALTNKAEAISAFIAKRINLKYIPAVRTAHAAHRIVDDIVDAELARLEGNPEYQAALKKITEIQNPELAKISTNIQTNLQLFIPSVKSVRVSIQADMRRRALRNTVISIDDGTPTSLDKKGDGVQSLAALSLMHYQSSAASKGSSLILAIEEPESHLHPSAISRLKKVIADLSANNQVIMTSHCPIFVDRTSISSNIIVKDKEARPATSVGEIREVLGVRAADNLMHAEVVLVVEGEDDRRALSALLRQQSAILKDALAENTLAIDSLNGGSNLAYKLGLLRNSICVYQCLLDDDYAGREAIRIAENEGLLTKQDCLVASVPRMKESEFEDVVAIEIYKNAIESVYGVKLEGVFVKGRGKWSTRLQTAFDLSNRPFNDSILQKIKKSVADSIEVSPEKALNSTGKILLKNLITCLENKIGKVVSQ